METTIYNQKGEQAGKLNLPESLFGLPWNADLVHQVVVSMQANARTPVAHTKDRGDVSGGGKKPWRQKGTGRARHGSTRSPIWVGGGVAHGPRNEKIFARKINKKMKAKALFTVLSRKLSDGEALFVEGFSMKEPKTREAEGVLATFAKVGGFETLKRGGHSALLVLPEKNQVLEKSFRNIGNVSTAEVRNLNPVEVLNHRYVIFVGPNECVELLSKRGKAEAAEPKAKKAAPKKKLASVA